MQKAKPNYSQNEPSIYSHISSGNTSSTVSQNSNGQIFLKIDPSIAFTDTYLKTRSRR